MRFNLTKSQDRLFSGVRANKNVLLFNVKNRPMYWTLKNGVKIELVKETYNPQKGFKHEPIYNV